MATDDPAVAAEIAAMVWAEAMRTAGPTTRARLTLTDLATLYLSDLPRQYPPSSRQPRDIGYAVSALTEFAGSTIAEAFGPRQLEALRATLVRDQYARKLINKRVCQIVRMFRWAVRRELVPASVHQALKSVEGLRKGNSVEIDGQVFYPVEKARIMPVHPQWVAATVEHAVPIVADMINLQMLTGMRSGELVRMRPCDVDTTGKVWQYTPAPTSEVDPEHKTEHHGHARVIAIGPKAQKILRKYLLVSPSAWCFAPAVAEEQRREDMRRRRKSNVQPSQIDRSKPNPAKTPGDCFTTGTWGQTVENTIKRANVRREADGKPLIPHWHPHQLRHTAATITRKEIGRDAARALLGQKTLGMVDLYAELDESLANDAAARLG
jgi:integrase